MVVNWNVALASGESASLEFLETAAIAYAIARSGYKREAVSGCIAGFLIVTVAAIALGTNVQFVPLHWLQMVTGTILLWFGWNWTKKAVKRQATGKRAGWINDDPLAAEGISLDSTQQEFSQLNFFVMTKSAALEAFEVAVIVITLGLASEAWVEAIGATGIALAVSVFLVVALHPYLVKVPDAFIKLGAGILLCSLGTFWLGEGLGFDWLFGDWAISGLIGLYAIVAWAAIALMSKSMNIPAEANANSTKVS
ncbi:MAG: hypothetical protein AAGA75_19435 [Cyanobacteria bacterium P01_E01_bin.6]